MLKHTQPLFRLIYSNRFIYRELAEIDDATEKLQQFQAIESAVAGTIDDQKYTWEKSKEEGEIHKYMEKVGKRADVIIPPLLKPHAALAAYENYGGEKGKNGGSIMKERLSEFKTDENWETAKKSLNFQGISSPLVDEISKSKTLQEARVLCDNFDTEWRKREKVYRTSREVDESRTEVLANIEKTAVLGLDERQKARFMAAEKVYIVEKVNGLFSVDPLDPQKSEEQKRLATSYIEGLMTIAEMKPGKDEIRTELDRVFHETNDDAIKNFVAGLMTGKTEGQFWMDDQDCYYKNASPDVRAYMEGLLDAFMDSKEAVTAQQWSLIMSTYYSIPENQRNYLPAVKEAFTSIHKVDDFEVRREKFIQDKCAELFPGNEEDSDIASKREIAYQYLKGLLSSAVIEFTESRSQDEFQYYYETFDITSMRQYVEEVISGNSKEGFGSRVRYASILSSSNTEVRAFMEGLLASLGQSPEDHPDEFQVDDMHLAWVRERYEAIPKEDRNDVEKVKVHFRNAHVAYTMDQEKTPGALEAMKIIDKQNWQVSHFYQMRMLKACETFIGKPEGEDTVIRYSRMLLNAISKQKFDAPDMDVLNALPMPLTFEMSAVQVSKLPLNAEALKAIPEEIKHYVKNVAALLDSKSVIFSLKKDNRTYYIKTNPLECYRA